MSLRRARLSLLAILLLAFALRVWRLGAQELRGDEAFGYFFSLPSPVAIVEATLELEEPHPVASYVLAHYWLGMAGHSEFALRFLSTWFGTVAVALMAALGRRLALPAGTLLGATALLAISPYAIWHSQDARMYSMSLALTLAVTVAAVAWLRQPRWGRAIACVILGLLALHTHYFNAFVLVALNLYALLATWPWAHHRRRLLGWAGIQAGILAGTGPWLWAARHILAGYHGNGDSPPLPELLRRSFSVFAVGEAGTPPAALGQQWLWAGLSLFLVLLGGVTLLRAWSAREERWRGWLLLLYLAVPLAAIAWSSRGRPIFNERYLVAAAPPFYLLLAAGLAGVTRLGAGRGSWPRLAAGLLAVLMVGGMVAGLYRYHTEPAYGKTRGWRLLAAALERFSAAMPPAAVRIVQNYPDPTLWYYYRGPVEHLVLPPAAHDRAGAQALVEILVEADVRRVLLPIQPAANWDPDGIAEAALQEAYSPVVRREIGNWPLVVYVRPPALTPLAVALERGLTLAGVSAEPMALPPGGLLAVHLAWQRSAGAALQGSEKVSVQLLDGSGRLVAQDDRPLPTDALRADGAVVAAYGILIPDDLPSGSYTLIAGVYDPAVSGAPRLLTRDGEDRVALATVVVLPAE
ncbi:MAG: hypothetical protein KatS3mg050_2091 [Litorilinea sp.]|nr:MAG: hypothetical protein KatS3mg050_2091 [Litorilinea sp.]